MTTIEPNQAPDIAAPWHHEIDDLSGSLLVEGANNRTVCEVYDRTRMDIACLIAAAPSMRDVLESIAVDPMALNRMSEEMLRGWAMAAARISADALAKATGGSDDHP